MAFIIFTELRVVETWLVNGWNGYPLDFFDFRKKDRREVYRESILKSNLRLFYSRIRLFPNRADAKSSVFPFAFVSRSPFRQSGRTVHDDTRNCMCVCCVCVCASIRARRDREAIETGNKTTRNATHDRLTLS